MTLTQRPMYPKSFKPTYVKMIADYEERLRSLRSDGYCLRFDSRISNFYCASLKHMANGNSITLSLNFSSRTLRQLTNRIVTHQQVYPESV